MAASVSRPTRGDVQGKPQPAEVEHGKGEHARKEQAPTGEPSKTAAPAEAPREAAHAEHPREAAASEAAKEAAPSRAEPLRGKSGTPAEAPREEAPHVEPRPDILVAPSEPDGRPASPARDEPARDEEGRERDRFVCFASGTLIHALGGQVPVEAIRAGDRVMTADHGFAAVRWAGRRTVRGHGAMAPVLIAAGALGNARDLRVSQRHRMVVSGPRAELLFGAAEVLVAARALVDGRRVRLDPCAAVTYHHLLFDAHEIVFAEGAATESFHPGAVGLDALDGPERAEILALFPELARDEGAYGPAARDCLRPWEARALSSA